MSQYFLSRVVQEVQPPDASASGGAGPMAAGWVARVRLGRGVRLDLMARESPRRDRGAFAVGLRCGGVGVLRSNEGCGFLGGVELAAVGAQTLADLPDASALSA